MREGEGSASILVKALKGEAPFGKDLPTPPVGARFRRMPSRLAPVSGEDIAFIEKWIDEGCLEDPLPTDDGAKLRWHPTTAPPARRYDDIWHVTPEVGWAVNSDGKILHTGDSWDSWEVQQELGSWLRCVSFASESRGWVGTTTPDEQLYETRDGGASWTRVTNLPDGAPAAVCGLWVVDESVVYASGTNFPFMPDIDGFPDPPAVMKTEDGGKSWQAFDMRSDASLLVDAYFPTAQRGWVVGGKLIPRRSLASPLTSAKT